MRGGLCHLSRCQKKKIMELPQGFTIDEIREIVEQHNKLDTEVHSGFHRSICREDWDDLYNGLPSDPYIDRYIQIGDAEYCITTSYIDGDPEHDELDADGGLTYLSEYVKLNNGFDMPEDYSIHDLIKLVEAHEANK